MKDNDIGIEELAAGHGAVADRGDTVAIIYDGFLNKGEQFDKAVRFRFTIGKREVIAGLEHGVIGMKIGGRRRLRIGPHLAYREKGVPGKIPANALLILEVELVELEKRK